MALRKFEIRLNHRMDDYPDDIKKIQEILIEAGWDCSFSNACTLWELYSESMCAGWMMLPGTDAGILKSVDRFIDPIE